MSKCVTLPRALWWAHKHLARAKVKFKKPQDDKRIILEVNHGYRDIDMEDGTIKFKFRTPLKQSPG
jgi:hypothetical protein